MPANLLEKHLAEISKLTYANENDLIKDLQNSINLRNIDKAKITSDARDYVEIIRNAKKSFVENFINEYSLSTEEGVAIICLAESLLRIPDNKTANELVRDKLKGKGWKKHIKSGNSAFTNASSWGLMLTGKVVTLTESRFGLNKLIGKLGEPVILKSLKTAVKMISNEFIMGSELGEALKNSSEYAKQGYSFAFDLLGESSRTYAQAQKYYDDYLKAIEVIAEKFPKAKQNGDHPHVNLSVKLSALHPKVLLFKEEVLRAELLPKLIELAEKCEAAHISLTFDAEESFRQEIYLKVLHELITHKSLANYPYIGFVMQAYAKRTYRILDYIIDLAKQLKRKIPVRLVKGAYWDTEIKYSQEFGLEGYPVFTRKDFTDVSYLACARKIIDNSDLIYPQFATHNAQTVAAIKCMAMDKDCEFEFQKLQGMGGELHDEIVKEGYKCRIYAPVGHYSDLLAYLMRRLLENGANSSFVNLIADDNANIEEIIADPVEQSQKQGNRQLTNSLEIYSDERKSSEGFEMGVTNHLEPLKKGISAFKDEVYLAKSVIGGKKLGGKKSREIASPLDNSKIIGTIEKADDKHINLALDTVDDYFHKWEETPVEKRAEAVRKYGDLLHENRHELYALLMNEAGKNIWDAMAEVREAIDFARYYANEAERLMSSPIKMPGYTGEENSLSLHPRGVFVCISPWNFPLAIFSGQILAALATGNTVIAKAAENTSIVAYRAVELMLKAGIHKNAISLVIAGGRQISESVLTDARVKGVCFTGSGSVANTINRTLAARDGAIAPLIAETGGQNAMIVDSSALLEQTTDNIINSAFGSIGQRCSALRVAYIQEEIFEPLVTMLTDAMKELKIGNTWDFANDFGPVIDKNAQKELEDHVEWAKNNGKKGIALHALHHCTDDKSLKKGSYFAPTILKINSISDIKQENFGAILHIIPFKAKNIEKTIEEINSTGFGLTFGVQSRIEEKIHFVAGKIRAGNIYANRTTIGAQVGTHPFGGENLSGTGFKAGGPHYLLRFLVERTLTINTTAIGGNIDLLN